MKTILNFALYLALIAIAAAAPPIVVPSTQGVTVNINGAIAYPDHSMFFQTFDEESREDIVPHSASQIGLQITDKTLWVATGTEAGDWAPLITKAMLGLANVDNTSDLAKPLSAATQTALNGKQKQLTFSSHFTYYDVDGHLTLSDILSLGEVNIMTLSSYNTTLTGETTVHSVFGDPFTYNYVTSSARFNFLDSVTGTSFPLRFTIVNATGSTGTGIEFYHGAGSSIGSIWANISSLNLSVGASGTLNLASGVDAKLNGVSATHSVAGAKTSLGKLVTGNSSSDLFGVEFIGAANGTVSVGHGIRNYYTLNKGGSTNSGKIVAYDAVRWTNVTTGSETAVRVFGQLQNNSITEAVEFNAKGIRLLALPISSSGLPEGQLYIDPMTRQVYAAP